MSVCVRLCKCVTFLVHLVWYLVLISKEQCVFWDQLRVVPITPLQPLLPRCKQDNLSTAAFTAYRRLCVCVISSMALTTL